MIILEISVVLKVEWVNILIICACLFEGVFVGNSVCLELLIAMSVGVCQAFQISFLIVRIMKVWGMFVLCDSILKNPKSLYFSK